MVKIFGEKMEETNLVKFFGNNPFIKSLDVFVDNIGESYSKKEVEELSGLSKGALFKHWHKLEELNLVKVTRVFGNTKLYTLNKSNPLVKDILKVVSRMIDETAPKEIVAVAR